MAFSSIGASLVAVGAALKQELFQLVKDNFDDHETRINSVEGAINRITPWNGTVTNATTAASITGGFGIYQATADFTLNTAQIGVFDVSATSWTGTLEMDIQKSTSADFTSSTSIFTTKPSIDMTTVSDYDVSTNAVFGAGAAISTGEYIRLDISSLPGNGVLGKIQLLVEGEA